jgi:hypothetical protein
MEISRSSPAGLRDNANTQHGWPNASVRASDFRDRTQTLPVTVTGAHGGAGTTTVARLLGARDAGRNWPQPGEEKYPPRVLLVARTHAAGLMAVSQALAGYFARDRSRGPYLTGIVLVPDAPGRIPKPLKRRITVLESAVMIHRLPWVARWRLTDKTTDPRIAESLRAFAERASLTTTPALLEGETCD